MNKFSLNILVLQGGSLLESFQPTQSMIFLKFTYEKNVNFRPYFYAPDTNAAHVRPDSHDPRVTIGWMLSKWSIFSNLPAFLHLDGKKFNIGI